MPKGICLNCGVVHTSKMDSCMVSERTQVSKKSGKASKSVSREVSPEVSISEDMSAMSFQEREQQALNDIARIELEEHVYQLEEKRAHAY